MTASAVPLISGFSSAIRNQQLMPVLVARRDVNIQRWFALLVGFDACGQVHLQRMVVQHHFLRMGDQRGKTQKIAQRVVLCQLAQTLCARRL